MTPMDGWLGAALGGVCAGLLIEILRRQRPATERRAWSLALLAAALVYVAFAAVGTGAGQVGEPAGVLGLEGIGVMVFGALGALGVRRPRALAAGWALHVLWDLGHQHVAWVPGWYVGACLALDVVVALYLWVAASRHSADGIGRNGS